MSVVVDASVIIAVVVADERQDAVQTQLQSWMNAGEDMHAPAVLPYEVADVLARLVFDGALELSDVNAIWTDLTALGLVLHPFELIRDGREVAAITTRLRRRHATDSTYICLAERLGTALWTLDNPLARNAADLGLPVRLVS
ncbi:Predicted nucleic acid-binding protein, contains PIN domain [Modestobacter sp. DSM 44400]|uniref:type II toxin-antitoxin system VapC family toxin n=1 Tax=Modestobacter sp. DSM 44400 TaxID=1550230 RepID=UPI000894B1C1|nr:type II toxin-antitoxin system VapC family toxin [Modestobacter sp. DSM 44400]SDX68260.1 Predicted nucleic acid-binding protein, contains PIN domain [Modestobacter sp. DSM 44400]